MHISDRNLELWFWPVALVQASPLEALRSSQRLRPGRSLCTAPRKSGDWKFCGFWILQGNLSEVVDHPSGVDVDEDHDDGGDDGEYVDQVPVDDQTVKRPAFFRVGIGGVQNGLQEKRGGVIQYQCSTSWSSMNFAMAPPKKLMNNVGRTMTIVWTMFVTERTWFLRFSDFNLKGNPTSDLNLLPSKLLKLLPSKLLASALCEERWRWLGTCRRQVQTDSGQKYL